MFNGLTPKLFKPVEFQKDLTMDDVLNLQNIIENSVIVARNADRITLRNENFKSAIRLNWNKKEKKWLMTVFQENNGSPINTIVNDEPPNGGNGFRPPLTTKNNVNSPANNVNDFFSDSSDISPQINDAQTLADQQAHLKRSQQETNNFRAQKLKELSQSFQQPRTQLPAFLYATIPDTRQKIADLQNFIAQKQEAISRAEHPMQSVALSAAKRSITSSTLRPYRGPVSSGSVFLWDQSVKRESAVIPRR